MPADAALEANDAKDRHVAATAIRCNADAIITLNASDFRGESLRRVEVSVRTPGDLVGALLDIDASVVRLALRTMSARLRNPP